MGDAAQVEDEVLVAARNQFGNQRCKLGGILSEQELPLQGDHSPCRLDVVMFQSQLHRSPSLTSWVICSKNWGMMRR